MALYKERTDETRASARKKTLFALGVGAMVPAKYSYDKHMYNKKLFDMCNVGEQYELGYARNVVLRRCNALLDREDF